MIAPLMGGCMIHALSPDLKHISLFRIITKGTIINH